MRSLLRPNGAFSTDDSPRLDLLPAVSDEEVSVQAIRRPGAVGSKPPRVPQDLKPSISGTRSNLPSVAELSRLDTPLGNTETGTDLRAVGHGHPVVGSDRATSEQQQRKARNPGCRTGINDRFTDGATEGIESLGIGTRVGIGQGQDDDFLEILVARLQQRRAERELGSCGLFSLACVCCPSCGVAADDHRAEVALSAVLASRAISV